MEANLDNRHAQFAKTATVERAAALSGMSSTTGSWPSIATAFGSEFYLDTAVVGGLSGYDTRRMQGSSSGPLLLLHGAWNGRQR